MTSHVERRLSTAVASVLCAVLPAQAQWTHLPMEGKRTAKNTSLLKAMGWKAGWADYIIIYEGKAHFIELKRPRVFKTTTTAYQAAGSLSDAQKEFRAACIANSTPYAVCYSTDEVLGVLQLWGIPLKGKISA